MSIILIDQPASWFSYAANDCNVNEIVMIKRDLQSQGMRKHAQSTIMRKWTAKVVPILFMLRETANVNISF